MAGRLFTSESVTEGHPDKIADQISDSVLDELLRQDPNSRVAVETLVTTGLVVVAGEVTTEAYAEIPTIVRRRILDIGYDSSTKGFDGASCGVSIAIGQQSPDIAQGVDDAFENRSGESKDAYDHQGAGDQGLMFGYACSETATPDAPADRAGPPTRRAALGRPQGRDDPVPASRRQDPGHGGVRRRAGRPAGHRGAVHPARRRHRPRQPADPGHPQARGGAGARPLRPGHLRLPAAGQPDRSLRDRRPDGRRRSDRPEDHRRHLRRHGPARRRRLLRQGPVEGRPESRRTRCAGWPRTWSPPAWPDAARSRWRTRSARRTPSASTWSASAPSRCR